MTKVVPVSNNGYKLSPQMVDPIKGAVQNGLVASVASALLGRMVRGGDESKPTTLQELGERVTSIIQRSAKSGRVVIKEDGDMQYFKKQKAVVGS